MYASDEEIDRKNIAGIALVSQDLEDIALNSPQARHVVRGERPQVDKYI